MKKLILPVSFMLALASPAFAQTKQVSPAAKGPTVAQCNAGYKTGMSWTKQQFVAACAKVKAKNQGK